MKQLARFAGFAALLAGLLVVGPVSPRVIMAPRDNRPVVPLAERFSLPDEKAAPFGPEVDGLCCRVVVAPVVTHGQPIPFVVQVRNVSKKTRYIASTFDPHWIDNSRLQIVGPDGKELKQNQRNGGGIDPRNFRPIQAGETLRFDFSDIRELFASYREAKGQCSRVDGLGQEGKYALSYSYKCPKCPERYVSGQRVTEKNGKIEIETIYADTAKDVLAGAWQGTLTARATIEVRPIKPEDLTVHEWGVFTVFSDVKHANLNRRAEWGSLPKELYRQFPEKRLRWVPGAWDKPLIYFYTNSSLRVDVTVGFGEGAPVVWWPAVNDPVDDGMARVEMVKGQAVEKKSKLIDRLHWIGWLGPIAPGMERWGTDGKDWVKVKEFDLPKDCWLHEARLKDAAPFTTVGSSLQRSAPWLTNRPETEKFIYYDGLVPAPDYLRCVEVSDAAVTIKNTAKFPIGQLFAIDRRSDRKNKGCTLAYRAEAIGAGQEAAIALQPGQPGDLAKTARKALLDAGLFEAEADSLLKLWDKEFFHAEGLTVFCLIPPAEYDRMLPLTICPQPAKLPVRVGIALHPRFENGPKVREKVAALIKDLDAREFPVRDAATRALEQMGPWAVPQLLDALQAKPSLEVTRRIEQVLQKVDASEWLRQALASPGKK